MGLIKLTDDNSTKAQREFANVRPDECKHPLLLGGFGAGKTVSIAMRWLNLIFWRARNQGAKCKVMIVEPTKEMIRDILLPELNDFFNSHGIKHAYHKTHHNYTIWLKRNGKLYSFTALLRSSDVPESLTGKTLTDVIIDEYDKKHPIPKQQTVWTECISRIRKVPFGTVAVATTPEGYKNTYELWGECEYKEKKNFKLIRAKTYDNQFLPPDYIENLYDNYSEELVKQYVEAQFINLTQGKVYYAFDRELNSTTRQWSNNHQTYLFVDFNINPMKWAVGHWADGRLDIVSQVVQRNTYTEQMAREVGDRFGYETQYILYGDYSGNSGSTQSPTTDYQVITSVLPFVEIRVKPNPLVKDRINSVNSYLKNSKGLRRLFINPQEAPDVVKDFEQVIWHKNGRDIDKDTNKELTHITDAIGYGIEYEYSLKGKPSFQKGNIYDTVRFRK